MHSEMAADLPKNIHEILKKAEKYCAYQERCHSEVAQKLRELGASVVDAQDIMVHLVKYNFLNEERFAHAYAGGKYRTKNWGRKKIIYHLRKKGINEKLIESAVEQIPDDDYILTLENLIQKKDATLKIQGNAQRAAAMNRYLAQKGYETDLIIKMVKKYYGL